ncbi:MAG: FAD/FMN-containing dehydrogenases [uncultured Nocardioidaceae bacterium]|uniref:Delta(24)-sterol reductase n=1 Tax=uncultured Nocardioidaceae bacterium TaxID=253824 RepID=A0A6J4MQJ7_9ACTN|nr:MAG: FAD/FMN-containing dehydrogenases [uncultured Nocardioidaceae bacterium]
MSEVVGWAAHEQAVAGLRASYDAIPVGAPVRLAKRTSNLFRPRDRNRQPGLDVSGLRGVIDIDVENRTAEVQGMCTYEDLVDATLPHGLIPLVVPQLRTITLGGAVTGLGIESTSFRNGLPHESVLEMDVFTGDGDVVTADPGGEHARLFRAFPNSYGSLGYATRIRIELEPVPAYVTLRHIRFDDLDALAKGIDVVVDQREWEGTRVDAVDGVVFAPNEAYLTLARWTVQPADVDAAATSDYSGDAIYYRSIQQREHDALTMHDYLWRWDTDWFWCSRAFGAQNPKVRRLWPKRYLRSDVYHRIVGLEHRFGVKQRIDARRGRPPQERVVQDVEVPVDRVADFLRWFETGVGMRPVWLCPIRLRETGGPGSASTWPTYPLEPATTYVNVGFWGTVSIEPGAADGDVNRAVEAKVTDLGGHKSLYSDAYYDRETFSRLYDEANLTAVKHSYDPEDRLTGLYEKVVKRR